MMIKNFRLTDGLLGRQARLVCDAIVPYQEKIIHDEIENAVPSYAIANFRNAAYLNRHGQ